MTGHPVLNARPIQRQRPRANPVQVFWYRGSWCWTCWFDQHRKKAMPHKANYGFATPGAAADDAREHFTASHPAELIIRLAQRGANR